MYIGKKNILLLLFLFLASASIAQSESGGFYIGYNYAKFSPGLGNVRATTYMYNQQYDANFKYNPVIHGPVIGARLVKGPLVMELAWMFRHGGRMESTFIEPSSNSEWKLGFKTRYNSWLIGLGIHFGRFTVGGGVEMAKFKLFTKRLPIDEYDNEAWEQKENLYGEKVIISELLDFTGAGMLYVDFMPKTIGFRAFYSIPLSTENYSSASASYKFRPTHFGISLLFNLVNAEYK